MKFDKSNCVDYLRSVFFKKERRELIRRYKKVLRTLEYSHIVVSGVSGLIIGPTLAYLLGKELVVIRKYSDKSHSQHKVESISHKKRKFNYVIVDDLVSSGATVENIVEKMTIQFPNSNPLGIYTYMSSGSLEVIIIGSKNLTITRV